MTPSQPPQTFEEWWVRIYRHNYRESVHMGEYAEFDLRAAFAAGVASQQAEIESLRELAARMDTNLNFGRLYEEAQAEIERLKADREFILADIRRQADIDRRHYADYEAVVETARELLLDIDIYGLSNLEGIAPAAFAPHLRAALSALEKKP